MAARVNVDFPVDPSRDAEFDRAFELLRDLVDWSAADEQFPVRGNAVYTTGVVLWMLVSQRMSPERSLESAVKRLIDTQPDFLPRNKRLTAKTLSNATGGYSRARSRLQRDAAKWLAENVRDSLIEATAPSLDGRRVYLVDGIVMADAGFGLFAVAWDARQTNRDFVFRLTESRFTALRRKATVVASDENGTTYSHTWRPSAKERQTHPGPQRRDVPQRIADLAGGLQLGDTIPPPSRRAHRPTPTPHELQTDLDHVQHLPLVLASQGLLRLAYQIPPSFANGHARRTPQSSRPLVPTRSLCPTTKIHPIQKTKTQNPRTQTRPLK